MYSSQNNVPYPKVLNLCIYVYKQTPGFTFDPLVSPKSDVTIDNIALTAQITMSKMQNRQHYTGVQITGKEQGPE